MTWEYALIGLVVGIIIGAVAMRFGNRKLRQQQALQYELEKNKAELDEYREELVSHFARSAELLDTMAHDYRQLYQHMAKSSSSLLPELSAEANPFRNRLAEYEASNDQTGSGAVDLFGQDDDTVVEQAGEDIIRPPAAACLLDNIRNQTHNLGFSFQTDVRLAVGFYPTGRRIIPRSWPLRREPQRRLPSWRPSLPSSFPSRRALHCPRSA